MSTGDEGPSLLEQMMAAREAALPQKNTPAATEETVKEKKTFGAGFKKGFLSGGGDDKPKKQNTSSIPTISAKPAAKGVSTKGFVLPEVQSAVDEATPPMLKALQSGEWVTPSLQEKIAKNPGLLQKFQDPRFAIFLQEMSKDPKNTMIKYKDNLEVQSFMAEMGQVLGDHFTQLGGSSPAGPSSEGPVSGPLVEEALLRQKEKQAREKLTTREEEEEEQARVNKILSDPVLRGLLTDPNMQRVLQDCQQPGGMARHLRDPETAKKIRTLAEAGLVQIQ